MAGFKITVGLDDSQITRDAKEAAEETAEAFDDVDIGGVISKSARSGFEQVGKDAKTMASKAAHELDNLARRGFFSRIADQARTAFNSIASVARSVFSSVGNIIQNALGVFGGNLLTSAITQLTSLLKSGAEASFDYNAKMENLKAALQAVTGDAALAAKQIEQIEKLAAKTPFEFPDLAEAALLMQSFGFSAAEVEKHLKAVADAGSRAGLTMAGGPQQGLQAVATVLGQIASRAELTTQDLLQLQTKALPVFDILKKAGEAVGKDFVKELEAGRVSGPAAARVLLEEFGKIPGILDFALQQSKTYTGKISNLVDITKKRLGQAGEGAFEESKKTLDKITAFLEGEGGDKLVKALAPSIQAPVDFLNRALDAVQKGTVKEFLVDEAKAAVVEMFQILKAGFESLKQPLIDFLNTAVITPITNGIAASVNAAMELIKLELLKAKDTINQVAPGVVPKILESAPKGQQDYGRAPRTLEEWRLFFQGKSWTDPANKITPQKQSGPQIFHPGGVIATPQTIAFQQTKTQLPPEVKMTQDRWEKIMTEYQRWLENERKKGAAGLPPPAPPPGSPNLPIAPNLVFSISPAIPFELATPPGALPAARTKLIEDQTDAVKDQTAALVVNVKQTDEATAATVKNAQGQSQWAASLFTAGEAAQQVFDFGLRQTFEGMVSSVVTGSVRLRDAVTGAILQIRSRVGDFLAQGLGNILFGSGGTGAAGAKGAGGGGAGGFFGNLFGGLFGGGGAGGTGGGGLFGGLFSGGGGAAGGAARGAGGAGGGGFVNSLKAALGISGADLTSGLVGPTAQGAGTTAALRQAFGLGPAKAGIGGALGGAFGGLLGGLLAAGPSIGFLGGTALGGKSLGGQILGGAGGLIAGASAATLGYFALGGTISAGLAGSTAGAIIGLLANPLTLALGGALLVGAYFLGKAKQRRQDETAADAIWVNEREQTRAIIAAVNSDRMDGGEAIAAHAQLRAQTISQLNQIKTKSVRDSRLNNQLRDLDNSIVRELQEAVARQAKRRGIIPQLTPEFAGGGVVPGIDRGVDSVFIKARPGEVILNQAQQTRLSTIAGAGIFQRLGLPSSQMGSSFQGGGFVNSGAGGPDITIQLVLESEGEQLGTLIAKGLKTSTGSRATVRVMDSARRNGEF